MGGKAKQSSDTTQTSTSDDTLSSIIAQLQQTASTQDQTSSSNTNASSQGSQQSTGTQQQNTQQTGQTAGTSNTTAQNTGTTAATNQQTGVSQNTQQQTQQGTQQNVQQATGQNVQTTQLAAGQQPNVDLLLSGARDAYKQGSTDPLQAQARQQAAQYAQGTGANLVGQALSADQGFLDPSKINNIQGDQNYQTLAGDVTARANKNLMEQILPQVRAGGIATGNLGGSADAILQGQAIGNSNAGLASALAGLGDSAVNRNMAAYQAAQSRVGTNYNLGLAPSSTIEQIGGQNIADRNASLGLLQGLTGTAGQYGGTTTQQNQQQQTQQGTSTNTGLSTGTNTTQQQGTSTGTSSDTSAQQTANQQQTNQQGSSTGTNTQDTQNQQTSQQQQEAQMQTQISEILRKLGLTDSTSSSDSSGTAHTTGKGGGGSNPLGIVGTGLSLASLFM